MLSAEQYREAEFGYTLKESQKGFVAHVIVFGLVMTSLIAMNVSFIVFTDADFPWAIFPLVGWGIGLTFHDVYGYRRAAEGARIRRHKVEEYAGPGEATHLNRAARHGDSNRIFTPPPSQPTARPDCLGANAHAESVAQEGQELAPTRALSTCASASPEPASQA